MDIFIIILFFIFGTTFGSFFNVVGLRVPKNISFHKGRSYCPSCKTTLRYVELIPIFSYIIQGGKCRTCKTKISPIYPIIELLTGLLFAFAYYSIGFSFELIVAILFISMLMILFVSDLAYMLIPDKVLIFFLPLFIIFRILSPLDPWYDSIIGGVVGFCLLALIILLSKGGMGAGDMKLFGLLGIILGFKQVLLTFFLAALFGALFGGLLMLLKKVKKRQPIPFGPFIVIASLISYFFGNKLIQVYLSFL